MTSGTIRTIAGVLAVLVLVAGCGDSAPSKAESRDAGRDYGNTLVDTLGSRASVAQLQQLCGTAIVDGKLKDVQTGKPGKKAKFVVKEFVAGCNGVVTGK